MTQNIGMTRYPNAEAVNNKLELLKQMPIYSINRDYLKEIEAEYFDKKCAKSKELTTDAKNYIPGGVQHNLAFNHPFPLAVETAKGAYLYDVDGNKYYDFLQAGGPVILGSNPDSVRDKVIELLMSIYLNSQFQWKDIEELTEEECTTRIERMLELTLAGCFK